MVTQPPLPKRRPFRNRLQRYLGSLINICVGFPIFASGATVCLYLGPAFPLPKLGNSIWYAPVYGLLLTCIVFLVFAALYYHFATAARANAHVYGMLSRYYSELKGRLAEPDIPDRKTSFQIMLDSFDIKEDKSELKKHFEKIDKSDGNTSPKAAPSASILKQHSTQSGTLDSNAANQTILNVLYALDKQKCKIPLSGSLVEGEKPNNETSSPQIPSDDKYVLAALRKAHEAYCDLHELLFSEEYNTGVEWSLGTAYILAWRMIHRIQEALIEFEEPSEVIGDVIHDVRAIQHSKMPDSNALMEQLLKAVKALSPDALIYFEHLKGDKNFTAIFPEKSNTDSLDVTRGVMLPRHLANIFKKPNKAYTVSLDMERNAREAIRQAKHALNAYQDSLWSALLRVRNYLSASIAVTGLVTHLLLCMVILLDPTPNLGSHDPYRLIVATAATYYIVGAIGGLFGRFYNEANSEYAPDDYGLFLSRLVATPLLSGLAAIAGVLITTQLLQGGQLPALSVIFKGPPAVDYLLAAAIFGFAPNLIMTNLQQRIQKYATDLQNTKGEASKEN